MANQTQITEKMRAILVDWTVEVHKMFKLMPETLFLTCAIIDRYLGTTTNNYLSFLCYLYLLITHKIRDQSK